MKTLRQLKSDYEKGIIEMTLRANRGNQRLSARVLGLSQRGLQKAIARHRQNEGSRA